MTLGRQRMPIYSNIRTKEVINQQSAFQFSFSLTGLLTTTNQQEVIVNDDHVVLWLQT